MNARRPFLAAFALACALGLSQGGLGTLAIPSLQAAPDDEWPQFGRDAQRSNGTAAQVDPPYCYAWKWYGPPIASRAQPVVADGRLVVGSMDGKVYARAASSGAALWEYATDGPIRHSAALLRDLVVTGSHDGHTYALTATDGRLAWKTRTGPSQTAPLVDQARDRIFVASTDGVLTALSPTGVVLWRQDLGSPILVSPSLSADSRTVLAGTEAVEAVALDAVTGAFRWRTRLNGQSLADRAPVVAGSSVVYRTQPLDFFHLLLHEGDAAMDEAGPVQPDWDADWAAVRPKIIGHLASFPHRRTLFVLDAETGTDRGVAPVLYTHGNNDPPSMPARSPGGIIYVPYRARHGIQTDSGTVHVSSRYDAELGRLDLTTLDIAGLRHQAPPTFSLQFRLTSDEPAQVTVGGDWLLVDNWERLGAVNIRSGALAHLGAVSNDWPECWVQCGPGSSMPFFPMSGSGPAYPFPSPRVTEGRQRPGAVVSHGRIFWRVVEGGLAAFAHRDGATCPAPVVHGGQPAPPAPKNLRLVRMAAVPRDLREFVWLTASPARVNPADPLVARLRREVRALVVPDDHPLPFYLQRGFSSSLVWPSDTSNPPGLPAISYGANGSAFWHDPAELLYTLAASYPYLDGDLQDLVRQFVARETALYPPLRNLPWSGLAWLKKGASREPYQVPFRESLNNWPPPAQGLAALYAVWRWVEATSDIGFAQAQWPAARTLFAARKAGSTAYADIAGSIGYARLATRLGDTAAAAEGEAAAVEAMTRGLDFDAFHRWADATFKDPRDVTTGWSLPVFFGLTREVGRYLQEWLGAPATSLLRSREEGDGLRWWYLTRAGVHAEIGETSYLAPWAAWSHFLAHAYVAGAPRYELEKWLDRPWGRGDLYSIQKLVATLEAN